MTTMNGIGLVERGNDPMGADEPIAVPLCSAPYHSWYILSM